MKRVADENAGLPPADLKEILANEAVNIRDEDAAMCRAIGEHGAHLLKNGWTVLTHCNAGGLATSEFGTALAPIYVATEQGKSIRVFADETRPLLQGARLTVWELMRAGIDVTLICDNMAAQVMKEGRIDAVLVGADRIAANGDSANKIGTYGVALLARAHRIPFYVLAPSSTIDLKTPNGSKIPIEERGREEVTRGFGKRNRSARRQSLLACVRRHARRIDQRDSLREGNHQAIKVRQVRSQEETRLIQEAACPYLPVGHKKKVSREIRQRARKAFFFFASFRVFSGLISHPSPVDELQLRKQLLQLVFVDGIVNKDLLERHSGDHREVLYLRFAAIQFLKLHFFERREVGYLRCCQCQAPSA